MGDTRYVHKISRSELCALLGIDEQKLAKSAHRWSLPRPHGVDSEGPWWPIPVVRQWLTSTAFYQPRQMLLQWRPDATEPAQFAGAHIVRRDRDPDLPVAVLQVWSTHAGTIVVAWPLDERQVTGQELAGWVPGADAYLVIGYGWAEHGPDVWAYTAAEPAQQREIDWKRDLLRVLGRPAPFWPAELLHADLIAAWRPGHPPARHVGVAQVDINPMLRMALLYPAEHVVHRAMLHTALLIHNRSSAAESGDLQILAERLAEGQLSEDDIALAALPAVSETEDAPREPDEPLMRAGWREVLARNDRLAEQCVAALRAWDGGKFWPFARTITIPRTPAGREFLDRLRPASERTAVYSVLDYDRIATAMIDPYTDIPVAVPGPGDATERIVALAPQRLPATSPLAALVLDDPVWIRTADGVLYPAPHDFRSGLGWGYTGSGPRTLAALTHALLADINAVGATVRDEAPAGLVALFQHEHPTGTTFTRAQLEAARDSGTTP